MTKRWSSGREDLPIVHEERPFVESVIIVMALLALTGVLTLSVMVVTASVVHFLGLSSWIVTIVGVCAFAFFGGLMFEGETTDR